MAPPRSLSPKCPFIAAQLAAQINGTNSASLKPHDRADSDRERRQFHGVRGSIRNQNFLGSQAVTRSNKWAQYAIASVISPTSITVTTSADTQTGFSYLAPGGGRIR